MALDDRMIPAPVLDMFYVDKDTGLPLAGGLIYFYEDDHSTLKNIYELVGTAPPYTYAALPNPIVLNIAGQVVNAAGQNTLIYLFPFDGNPEPTTPVTTNTIDLYHIVCMSAGGATQWTRSGIPSITADNDPTQDKSHVGNQISNSQFARVWINDAPSTVYTATASEAAFKLAPNWDIVISGAGGTATVIREVVAGNESVITTPPYSLKIVTSGAIETCYLRQRMDANSGLWASTLGEKTYLSGSFIAENTGGSSATLSLTYRDSNTAVVTPIVQAVINTAAGYVESKDSSDAIPVSTNATSGVSGWIDILLNIPPASTISVSSIQVVPTKAAGNLVEYDANTTNRETALTGDYFIPALSNKAVPSYLVGWDFPVNPTQFGEAGTVTTGTPKYIWDQTICDSFSDDIAYARNSVTGSLEITTTAATTGCYILQYLSGNEVKRLIDKELSVNVNAYCDLTAGEVTGYIYLYRAPQATAFPTLSTNTTIGTVATTGIFTDSSAGWTKVTRSGLGDPKFTLNTITGTDLDIDMNHGFNGFQIKTDAQQADTDKFAIVVSFGIPGSMGIVTVNSVSLVPGSIPTIPAPQTPTEVLNECQYYYQKSFPIATVPAQNAGIPGSSWGVATNVAASAGHAGVLVEFQQRTISTPDVVTYNPSVGNAVIRNITRSTDSATNVIANTSSRGFTVTGNFNASGVIGDILAVHWSADSRLGI